MSRPPSRDPAAATTPRRDFLGQLATATIAVTGGACAASVGATPETPLPRAARVTPATPARRAAPPWDDAWVARITAPHRAVFDAPEIADGLVLTNAFVYMRGYREAYRTTDAETQAVLVIRHRAIPMALDDALWGKYELGKEAGVKDPATGEWARRNPFQRADPADTARYPDQSLEALRARGAILVGCNLAAMRIARQIAERTRQSADAVGDEVRRHLVPGLTLAPNGVFAVMRAQEAGCTFLRSA